MGQSNNKGITSEDVREYMRDYKDSNRLNQAEEFSESRINLCIDFALDDFNNTPVQTAFTAEKFPARAILMLGVIAHLYKGEKFFQARNNLTYNDAGVTVNDNDKAPVYAELSSQLMQEFETKTRQWKRQYNLRRGWGGFNSEYRGLYRTR